MDCKRRPAIVTATAIIAIFPSTDEDNDANGDKLDPFCGSNDAASPFATYFPVLRTDPDTGVML